MKAINMTKILQSKVKMVIIYAYDIDIENDKLITEIAKADRRNKFLQTEVIQKDYQIEEL